MAVSSSIQFFGRDAALQAFEHRQVEVWSLWQGRNLLTKGEGAQQLAEYLDMIANGGTNAIYTVKVYEDLNDVKKVKSNTPDDGSYNFRLNDPNQSPTASQIGSMNRTDLLFQEIRSLHERLDKMDAVDDHDDEDDTITIAGLLKDPDHLGKLIDVGKKLLGVINPGAVQSPALIGQVTRAGQNPTGGQDPTAPMEEKTAQGTQGSEDAEKKLQRLGDALDILEANDPHIVEHLEKLAAVAKQDPTKFKSLISILDVWN